MLVTGVVMGLEHEWSKWGVCPSTACLHKLLERVRRKPGTPLEDSSSFGRDRKGSPWKYLSGGPKYKEVILKQRGGHPAPGTMGAKAQGRTSRKYSKALRRSE